MRKLASLLFATLGFVRAASAGTVQVFGNGAPITINDSAVATPYPSNITVSGVAVNTAANIRVVLSQFSHDFPQDVDILLVGPQGQRCMLMSDAVGTAPVSNVDLTFSSTAATVLPQSTAPATGGYRPANYSDDLNSDPTDTFAAPGPGTLTSQAADLTVFNLIDPNGVWSLYVVDDLIGGAGSIANGWALLVTVPTIFTVNSTADPGDGVCDVAECTLREAINAAIANTGNSDLINFTELFNTPQTINLQTALPDISESMTIQGPGANLLTVRRDYNAATDFRIFTIASGLTNGVTMTGVTVAGGNASNGNFGGGIYSLSNLTLTNVHVTGNTADLGGGGVNLSFADGVFTNCTFSNNSVTGAAAAGGGILFEGGGGQTLHVVASTVSGNRGDNGSGIGNAGGSNSRVEITSSTVTNNSAKITGGGIFIFTNGAGTTATTTLRNTIVAGNSPNNLATHAFNGGGAATMQTLGFNLSDNYNGVFTPLATDKTGQPLLGPLSLIGGQTPTHALLGGSPALDAGDASGLTTDQRGQPRVFGSSADIGAAEMRRFMVTNAADSGKGSLRVAIPRFGDFDLTDVLFDNTVFNTPHTISLTSGELAFHSSVMIHGPGANLLTVRRDPQAATDFRIFNILDGIADGVSISGMTISSGRATAAGLGGAGGGILGSSNLTLTNVHVTVNQANSGGGGVFLEFANGVFTGCTFSLNTTSGSAGGIHYQGDGRHTLRLVNSTVSGNSAAGGFGGGILNVSTSGNSSRLEVTNGTIASNTGGGGIFTFTQSNAASTATTTLRNTIIAGSSPNNLETGTFGGGATTVTTYGFNLASDNGGGFLNVAPITTDKINANAGLAPLADNGGTTPTHALLFGSAALDAGNDSGSGALTDQRGAGFSRSVDLSGIANAAKSDGTDIGAYEAAVPPVLGVVANVSTRLPVGIGDDALIEGFIVQGPAGSSKKILVRAIGPSLIPFGITDAVADPTLEIFDANNTKIASNDNWKVTQVGGIIAGNQFAEINGSGLAPGNDLESAIVANLAPGAYTAIVRGAGNTIGTGVVDAFDLSAASTARLANIATRGLIRPGDKLMIAGFIVQNAPVRVVVRAIGPSLTAFGITNALPDTTLQLRNQNGAIVRENDNWMSDQKVELETTGLQPSHVLEAALVQTIAPGQYTAQVRGKPETTGTGVVQIYFLQ